MVYLAQKGWSSQTHHLYPRYHSIWCYYRLARPYLGIAFQKAVLAISRLAQPKIALGKKPLSARKEVFIYRQKKGFSQKERILFFY